MSNKVDPALLGHFVVVSCRGFKIDLKMLYYVKYCTLTVAYSYIELCSMKLPQGQEHCSTGEMLDGNFEVTGYMHIAHGEGGGGVSKGTAGNICLPDA